MRLTAFLLVPALIVAPADASAQRRDRPPNALYETGTMGRLGDCITDGMIAGTAVGLVVGMFAADRSDLRVPVMLAWGVLGFSSGILSGTGFWAVHEARRSHAQRNERPDTITTPGPRAQAKILRTRPCRGTLPFTSAPAPVQSPTPDGLSWVREP